MEDIIRHTAFLRRLARDLVRSEAEADDLVQEGWLAALSHPPREPGAVRAWMGTVLRRINGRRIRAEQRRQTRERGAAAAEVTSGTGARRQDLLEALVHHLRLLPESSRNILFLRYFDGLSFLEIAERLNQDPEAVRSRHRRALEALRRELGGGSEGQAWRTLLVAPAAASVDVMTKAAGGPLKGALLTTQLKGAWAVALLIGAVGGSLWWIQSSSEQNADTQRSRTPVTSRAPLPADQEAGSIPREGVSSLPTIPFTDPDAADAGAASVRGRCIDVATGSPVAGCTVRLRGGPMPGAQVRPTPPTKWEDPPPATTGKEGGFSFRIQPPDQYAFRLDVIAEGRAWATGSIGQINAGQVLDLGDIALLPGATVTGRIVDATGEAQGTERIRLHPEGDWNLPANPAGIRLWNQPSARAGRDGSFSMAQHGVVVGRYRIEVSDRPLSSPATVELRPGTQHLEVVVVPDSEVPHVRGVVVTDTGTPVARATIDLPWYRQGPVVMTDAEGAFIFRRGPGCPNGPFSLTAQGKDHGVARTGNDVDWGTHDVRIVMGQSVRLQISVVDGDDGSPVEQFGVEYENTEGNRRSGTGLCMEGHHPGGVLRLSPVAPATDLIVVPIGTGHLPSRVHRLDVTPIGVPPLRIPVYRPVAGRLEVRDAGGRPVVGSRAQLVRRGAGMTLETPVLEPGSSSMFLMAAVTAAGETDASGAWAFSAPPHEPLVIRLLGPGHVPVVEEFQLSAAGQTVKVVVTCGARLTGTLTPGRFLDELPVETEGQPPPGFRMGLILKRTQPRRESHPPRRRRVAVESGSFEIEGIPAGTWDLVLHYPRRLGGGTWTTGRLVIENDVTLEPNQEHHLDIDLSHLLRSRLKARVSVDGRPWIEQKVGVRGGRSSPPRQRFHELYVPRTDTEGCFELSLWPGEYTVVALADNVWLPDTQPVVIGPDTVVDRQLAFVGVPMEIRVLRSDGVSPAEGVRLRFRDDSPDFDWTTPPSDAEGRIRIAAITRGASFKVFLPHLGNLDGPIPLGTMTATSGEGPQVVVLPPSSGY